MKKIMVEVSARHVHLTQEHVDILFGKGYQLTPDKYLSQPGQYLAKEKVTVIGPKKTFQRVAIIGPVRKSSQFELSLTDCFGIGVQGVLRESGHHEGTPGIEIQTELGKVVLDKGVIIAKRHIHMTPEDTKYFNVIDGQLVKVRIDTGEGRTTIFEDAVIRVSNQYALAMHIDTDEANATFVHNVADGELML